MRHTTQHKVVRLATFHDFVEDGGSRELLVAIGIGWRRLRGPGDAPESWAPRGTGDADSIVAAGKRSEHLKVASPGEGAP